MKKKIIIAILIVGGIIGGVLNALEDDTSPKETQEPVSTTTVSETTSETTLETTPETTIELSDAERLGVFEEELGVIEHVMSVAGWDYDRDDFERIYRLKDSEMVLNPANFVEYDVSLFDGETHRVTVNKDLLD